MHAKHEVGRRVVVDGSSCPTFEDSFLKNGFADFVGSLHSPDGALGVTASIFTKGSRVGIFGPIEATNLCTRSMVLGEG